MKPRNKLNSVFLKEETQQVLEKRLEFFNSPELYCVEGERLLDSDKPEMALRLFQKAVDLDSNSVRGLFGQGNAFTNMGEYAKALDTFHQVIRLDPKLAIAAPKCFI